MKSLSTHITESFTINENKKISNPIILQNLSWEEASAMIKKSGRDEKSLDFNIGYAEYYAAMVRDKGYGNGYDSGQRDYYLEKANRILDDEAFAKNQTIRRKLYYEYVQDMYSKGKGHVEGQSYKDDDIQKYKLSVKSDNGDWYDFEIVHDSNKDSNSFHISGSQERGDKKPLKLVAVDTFQQVKKKFDTYMKK